MPVPPDDLRVGDYVVIFAYRIKHLSPLDSEQRTISTPPVSSGLPLRIVDLSCLPFILVEVVACNGVVVNVCTVDARCCDFMRLTDSFMSAMKTSYANLHQPAAPSLPNSGVSFLPSPLPP